jgi:hypothetical protein
VIKESLFLPDKSFTESATPDGKQSKDHARNASECCNFGSSDRSPTNGLILKIKDLSFGI